MNALDFLPRLQVIRRQSARVPATMSRRPKEGWRQRKIRRCSKPQKSLRCIRSHRIETVALCRRYCQELSPLRNSSILPAFPPQTCMILPWLSPRTRLRCRGQTSKAAACVPSRGSGGIFQRFGIATAWVTGSKGKRSRVNSRPLLRRTETVHRFRALRRIHPGCLRTLIMRRCLEQSRP
jgi:hypothetical protein